MVLVGWFLLIRYRSVLWLIQFYGCVSASLERLSGLRAPRGTVWRNLCQRCLVKVFSVGQICPCIVAKAGASACFEAERLPLTCDAVYSSDD
jgi:hypothetical protein